jgi:hypothetical protein
MKSQAIESISNTEKQQYVVPTLIEHGSVASVTKSIIDNIFNAITLSHPPAIKS